MYGVALPQSCNFQGVQWSLIIDTELKREMSKEGQKSYASMYYSTRRIVIDGPKLVSRTQERPRTWLQRLTLVLMIDMPAFRVLCSYHLSLIKSPTYGGRRRW
jgi:hypothetical protein